MWGEVLCTEKNAEIHAYILKYYSTNSPRDQSGDVLGRTSRVFTARGLTPRTSYTFEVRANHFDFSALSKAPISSPPAEITITTKTTQSKECMG